MVQQGGNNLVSSLLPTRKLVLQLAGFVVGISLLGLIIRNAVRQGNWHLIADASPLAIAALLGCTLVSCLINGSIFWLTIQPVQHIRFWDMQRVNVVANMLNYLPVRVGVIARVAYHIRVDGLGLLQIAAWFSLIGYILVLGLGSCLLATAARDRIDWVWAGLVAGQLLLGGMAIRFAVGHPLVVRYGRGIDRMVASARVLWGAIALRVVDLAAYAGRMGVAAAILDIRMSASQVVVLSLVALAASLIPVGRVGFREFFVAAAGHQLARLEGGAATNIDLLALVESAGEALVFIPAGAMFLWWYKKKWSLAGVGGQGSGVRHEEEEEEQEQRQ